MATISTLATTVAGIAWDPQIRGLLSVLVGVVVLFGSVWYLVASNSGVRTGTLIAFAAFAALAALRDAFSPPAAMPRIGAALSPASIAPKISPLPRDIPASAMSATKPPGAMPAAPRPSWVLSNSSSVMPVMSWISIFFFDPPKF